MLHYQSITIPVQLQSIWDEVLSKNLHLLFWKVYKSYNVFFVFTKVNLQVIFLLSGTTRSHATTILSQIEIFCWIQAGRSCETSQWVYQSVHCFSQNLFISDFFRKLIIQKCHKLKAFSSAIKSFIHGHPPAAQKYFLIYPMNFDYCQQTKEKKKSTVINNFCFLVLDYL